MCFVMDCQKGSLLGSKDLGSKYIKTSTCNVGKELGYSKNVYYKVGIE